MLDILVTVDTRSKVVPTGTLAGGAILVPLTGTKRLLRTVYCELDTLDRLPLTVTRVDQYRRKLRYHSGQIAILEVKSGRVDLLLPYPRSDWARQYSTAIETQTLFEEIQASLLRLPCELVTDGVRQEGTYTREAPG